MISTLHLRAAAVIAVAALLMAIGAVASAPAQALVPMGNALAVTIQVDEEDLTDPDRPLDQIVLEIFDDEGALVAEGLPGGDEGEFTASNGADCESFREQFLIEVVIILVCNDMPAGDYVVGADNFDGWDVGVLECYEPTLDNPQNLQEPLEYNASVSLEDNSLTVCDLYADPLDTSVLYTGLGTTAPYSYTLELDTPPSLRIFNESGTVDMTLETFEEEVVYGAAMCAANNEEVIGWWSLCLGLPGGQYSYEIDTPTGLLTGEMYCDQINMSEGPDESTDVTTGRAIDLGWESFGSCLMYVGTGIPIYVDVTVDQDSTAEVDLADITVEAYDSDGTLVATATDPSLDTCEATEASEFPSDAVVSGSAVEDDSVCAVLWVKPPHNITTGEPTASETYTIGVNGADVSEYSLATSDLTWTTDGPINPIEFPEDEPIGQVQNYLEPLDSATVTLSVDYEAGTFSSGAIAELDVLVLAEVTEEEEDEEELEDSDDEELEEEEELAATGASIDSLSTLGAIVAALGFGTLGFAILRRRQLV